MADMLISLYSIDFYLPNTLVDKSVETKKTSIFDKDDILDFVKAEFPNEPAWSFECSRALSNTPIGCYIAVRGETLLGFCCFDATAKGFVGPLGAKPEHRRQRIGRSLLMRTLFFMRELDYAYAIVGDPAKKAVGFYERAVGAITIEGAHPSKSVYRNPIKK